jgi:hypothetical protein
MFPTIATIRAAKRDLVAGGKQQLHTDKVTSDRYDTDHDTAGHPASSKDPNLQYPRASWNNGREYFDS